MRRYRKSVACIVLVVVGFYTGNAALVTYGSHIASEAFGGMKDLRSLAE